MRLNETDLFNPIGQQEIKIVPIATGSRGFTRILAGAALITLAIVNPAVGLGLGQGTSLFCGTTATGTLGGAFDSSSRKFRYLFSFIRSSTVT